MSLFSYFAKNMEPPVRVRNIAQELETSNTIPVTLAKYKLTYLLTMDRWKQMWQNLVSKLTGSRAETLRCAAVLIINDISAFLTDIVAHQCAIPPGQLSTLQSVAGYEKHIADLLCVQTALRVLYKKFAPRLRQLDQAGNVHAKALLRLLDALADGPVYSFASHVITKWCECRRDDVFGAAKDGCWSTPLIKGVFTLVCISSKLWNKYCSHSNDTHPWYHFFLQLKRMTFAEFGSRYNLLCDQSGDRGCETDSMFEHCFKWLAVTHGTGLVPPSHTVDSVKFEALKTTAPDAYPWHSAMALRTHDFPWNRLVDADEIHKSPDDWTLTDLTKIVTAIRGVQDDLQWNALIEVYINYVVFDRVCKYVLLPKKKRSRLEQDAFVYDTAKWSKRFESFMMANNTMIKLELAFWNWLNGSTLCWAFKSPCLAKGVICDADLATAYYKTANKMEGLQTCAKGVLTKKESRNWTATLAMILREIKTRSTYRDVLKEAIGAVSPGYLVAPGDLELHYRSASKIASRRPLDLLNYFRPSEFRSIINLIFSPFSIFHCLAYASASLLKETGVTEQLTDDSIDSVDPLVPTVLKYSIYHKILPCLHQQVEFMQRLAKQQSDSSTVRKIGSFASVGSAKSGGSEKILSVDEIGKEVVDQIWNTVLDSADAQQSGVGHNPENFRSAMMDFFERKLQNKTDVGQTGPEIYEPRLYFAHYSMRSYGKLEDLDSGAYLKILRGAVPPRSFSSFFYHPTHCKTSIIRESSLETKDKTPFLIGVRGEYWVGTPGEFFGSTRCYEQALKWYTLECDKAGDHTAPHPDSISKVVFLGKLT